MTIPEVEKLIPHRGLMLRIDRLLRSTPDEVEGEFTLRPADPFLRQETLREAAIIESLAQAVAAGHGYSAYKRGEDPPIGFLTGIEQFRYLRPVRSGETLHLWAKVEAATGPLRITSTRASVGEEIVAEGTLKFFLK